MLQTEGFSRPEKNRLIQGLIDLIYPPKCVLCGRPLRKGEEDLCTSCGKNLHFTNILTCKQYGLNYHYCLSALYYKPLRESFLRYKFDGRWHYNRLYSRWLIRTLGKWEPRSFDVVTWVPLHELRRFFRGYDQTKLMAEPVARSLNRKLTPTLRKQRNIRPQSHLSGVAERESNIRGAFALRPEAGELIRGKSILLIDDIITTGSTLEEAAGVLRKAGAREVSCLTLARGE